MKTYGVILAGGRSSRFDGEDKAWLEWRGKPLIQHAIERIRPQVDELVISANNQLDRYMSLGYPVISDSTTGFQGPLMGIFSVMQKLAEKHADNIEEIQLFTMPCDMPVLPSDLKKQLQQSQNPFKIHVVCENQRLQPLLALIPLSFTKSLSNFLESGQNKVEIWIRTTDPVIVDLSDQAALFRNINCQSDLQLLQ